jgi:hypothetical protein
MKHAVVWLALILLCASLPVFASDPEADRGAVYLSGCAYSGGGLVGRDEAGDELWFGTVACLSEQVIWLETLSYDEAALPLWRVEDIVVLGLIDRDQDVVSGAAPLVHCEYQQRPVRDIVAIGTLVFTGDVGDLTGIIGAWIVNAAAKRIEAVSPTDVVCQNYLVN